MESLKGKVALITGGTKGIGYGVAEALLNHGLKVVITSRSKNAADAAAKELASKSDTKGSIIVVQADVRELASQEEAVNQALKTFGQLDIVVANAGLGH